MIRLSEQDGASLHPPAGMVAIVGMGCIFPKSGNLREFWRLMRRGEDAVGPVPETHWRAADYFDADPKKPDMTYCARGAFVEAVRFDPTEWGIPPTALEATDTAQLLALVAAKMALHDAGYQADPPRGGAAEGGASQRVLDRGRTGVILGVTGTLELALPLAARLGHPHWRRALKDAGVDERTAEDVVRRIGEAYVPWQENSFPGLLGNVVAGRIANRLDLRGTNCVVDAACASSLSALHLALLELQTGRADVMLSGGVDTLNDIFMFMCFSKTPALSPSGDARPFSDDADGTVIGEGVGVLVLKRLEDAEREGDRIYAVIRGIGSSSDGRAESIYAPRSAGQAAALRNAYSAAGVEPATVELIEAHGTGTKVGDVVEVEALRSVFGAASDGAPTCALGSVKSQVGHTKAAAGVAGLIKAALALYHRVLPATVKVRRPNPKLELENSPFYLNTELRPWVANPAHPRRAGVSAFGFGGSNFHVVLEEHASHPARLRPIARSRPRGGEHAPPRAAAWDGSVQLVALSAESREELSLRLGALADELSAASGDQLACLAAELRRAFRAGAAWRLVLVVHAGNTAAELVERARRLLTGADAGERGADVYLESGPSGKLAFLFPGQGSQYCGMGSELAAVFPEMLDALCEFEHVVTPGVARSPVIESIFPRAAFDDERRAARDATLTDTRAAQPALGATSAAMLRVLRRFGIEADCFAGHSFGELSALYAAGWIELEGLARLARVRGQLMARADGGRGAMAAVSGPIDAVESELRGGDVVVANRNSPTQVVISGEREQVAVAEARLRQRGFSVRRLAVGGAFHSPLVAAALGAFQRELALVPLSAGKPVMSCTTGEAYPAEATAARELLGEQLMRPVDFLAQVRSLVRAGVRTLVEVGPRSVLTSLVRAGPHAAGLRLIALDASAGRDGLLDLARALAQIAVAGHALRLDAWDPAPPGVRTPGMVVRLLGANYRAPRRVATSRISSIASASCAGAGGTPVVAVTARSPALAESVPPAGFELRASSAAPRPAASIERGEKREHPSERIRRSAVNTNQSDGNGQPTRVAPLAAPEQACAGPPAAQSGLLADAFRVVSEGVRAMQALQQQTAALHRRFIEGQEMAHKTIQHLIESQHHLVERALRTLPVASLAGSLVLGGANPLPPPTHGDGAAGAGVDSATPRHWMAPASAVPAPRPFVGAGPVLPVSGGEVGVDAALLRIVASKTGLALDETALDLHMEHDLGIDAITRGEILVELRDQRPDTPRLAAAQLEAVATLRELGARLRAPAGASAVVPVAAPPAVRAETQAVARPPDASPPPRDPPVASQLAVTGGVESALLGVVAELTGYPVEMLNVDMDMEGDLGIDSIKRVEILATLEQRVPDFPGVNPEYMGSLRTLRQILEYVGVARGNGNGNGGGGNGASGKEVASRLPKFEPQPALPAAGSEQSARLVALAASGRTLERLRTAVQPDSWLGAGLVLAGGREVWVTDDDAALAEALRERLARHGVVARLVRVGDPPQDASRVGGLIVVAPVDRDGLGAGNPASDRRLKSAFALVQRSAVALRSAAADGGALLASVSRMDGAFGLVDGAAAGAAGALAGLVKTASCEWPGVICRAFDVARDWDQPRQIAEAIVARLGPGGAGEIGLDARGARRVATERASLSDGEAALRAPLAAGDVVVVTGGARGVTAEAAAVLAEALRPTLVLLGRSPEPGDEPACLRGLTNDADIKRALADEELRAGRVPTPAGIQVASRRWLAHREIVANLARIHATGARCAYRQVDLRDAGAVRAVLADVAARLGPIRGLVHGAGVLYDRRIEDKTGEQFDAVFDTKIAGLRNVLAAVEADALRAVLLFSSVSGRYGRRGQVDYAMANEVLNKAAQHLRATLPQCRVRAINWGPWDGGMVDPALRRTFEREGVGVIPLAAGAAALLGELCGPDDEHVEIVLAAGEIREAWGSSAATTAGAAHGDGAIRRETDGTAGTSGVVAWSRHVDVETHPFLNSHVLAGRPVLPLAVSAEWLAQAAADVRPGSRPSAIRQLRALRPAAVGAEGLALSIQPQAGCDADGGDGPVRVELTGQRGERFASAEVYLAAEADATPLGAAIPSPRGGRLLDPAAVYRDILFHGNPMQALRGPIRVDAEGISAGVVAAPPPARWMTSPHRGAWLFDPLLLDSLLQLGIVWCHERHGVLCLPSFVAEYRQACEPPTDDLSATLVITKATERQIVADGLIHGGGAVHARLSGCVWTVDARLAAAFGRGVPHVQAGA
ncbi:MAG: hypothetical protein CHACPFDD_03753 [Phycisphaerae bacterium]|nr:hypothetical protein [Phycisphaerae bacterium]